MHPFVTKAILLVFSICLVIYWFLEWAAKWATKKAKSIAPWLKFLLQCLVSLSLEAMGNIVVHGMEYLVIPALLLLASLMLQVGFYLIFFNFNTPKFPAHVKGTNEEEKEKDKIVAGQLGVFSLLRHLGEFLPLLVILPQVGYFCSIYLYLVVSAALQKNVLAAWAMLRRKIHALTAEDNNEGEQEADNQELAMLPSIDTNTTTTTTTTGIASTTNKQGLFNRICSLLTSKKATIMPRRLRFALRNPFKGMVTKQSRACLSSAAIHERPTPTVSDATLEENRARSESGLIAWVRRASRAESVSVGLVRRASQSQDVGKKGEGEMVVADAC